MHVKNNNNKKNIPVGVFVKRIINKKKKVKEKVLYIAANTNHLYLFFYIIFLFIYFVSLTFYD